MTWPGYEMTAVPYEKVYGVPAPVIEELFPAKANSQWRIANYLLAPANNISDKFGATFNISAIFIRPLIGIRRNKIGKQITHNPGNLQNVKSRLHGAAGASYRLLPAMKPCSTVHCHR
jgi:hypothetical protein